MDNYKIAMFSTLVLIASAYIFSNATEGVSYYIYICIASISISAMLFNTIAFIIKN